MNFYLFLKFNLRNILSVFFSREMGKSQIAVIIDMEILILFQKIWNDYVYILDY